MIESYLGVCDKKIRGPRLDKTITDNPIISHQLPRNNSKTSITHQKSSYTTSTTNSPPKLLRLRFNYNDTSFHFPSGCQFIPSTKPFYHFCHLSPIRVWTLNLHCSQQWLSRGPHHREYKQLQLLRITQQATPEQPLLILCLRERIVTIMAAKKGTTLDESRASATITAQALSRRNRAVRAVLV